jgi:hypothetical protein
MVYICDDCRTLSIDLLSRNLNSDAHWRIFISDHAIISEFTRHKNHSARDLRLSVAHGCTFCSLIAETLSKIKNGDSAETYHLFVWGRNPEPCTIQICTAEISNFVSHVSRIPPFKTLEFFVQKTQECSTPQKTFLAQNVDLKHLRLLPDPDSGSPESFRKALGWLNECRTQHSQCLRAESKLPKRVLDLGAPDQPLKIALYISKDEVHPYVALSYTWGQSDRLVTSTRYLPGEVGIVEPECLQVKKFRPVPVPGQKKPGKECIVTCSTDDIPIEVFPPTQRDAIMITRGLGYQYLWIDSLCIIQDDKQDWAHQVVLLTDIYGGASLTISSSSTQSSTERILAPLHNDKCTIGSISTPTGEVFDALVGRPLKTLDLAEKFISTRGWVFQEGLVSNATLHYTDEGMVWECVAGTHCGHDQSDTGGKWKTRWRDLLNRDFSRSSHAVAIKRPWSSQYDVWYDFVCSYSDRNLFDVHDKFPALAGVARKFAQTFGLSDGSYLAGLWREDFLTGLLWRRHNRALTLERSNEPSPAPSWSWASVTGLLEHSKVDIVDSATKGPKLEFVCTTKEQIPGTYGELSEAVLLVKGYLQSIVMDTSTHPGVRTKAHQACGVSEGFVNNENVLCTLDQPELATTSSFRCWCLRIGSCALNGREGDAFLLLEKVSSAANTYRRVGYAETDAWFDRKAETPDSGLLQAAQCTELYIE